MGVKRQRREADHSPPSSAKVKNHGAKTSFGKTYFMIAQLIFVENINKLSAYLTNSK
jgi:hypothetical protein